MTAPSHTDQSDSERAEREYLEGLRYEDKFPDHSGTVAPPDVEIVARALYAATKPPGACGWAVLSWQTRDEWYVFAARALRDVRGESDEERR